MYFSSSRKSLGGLTIAGLALFLACLLSLFYFYLPATWPSAQRFFKTRVIQQQPKPSQLQKTEPENLPLPPIRIFHDKYGNITGCQLPRACMALDFGLQTIYMPEEYRKYKKLLNKCTEWSDPQFVNYSRFKDAAYHDIDLVGAPYNSVWFGHFPHFIDGFIRHSLTAASLFIGVKKSKALCVGPVDEVQKPCEVELKTRAAFSSQVLGKPNSWISGFVRLLQRSDVQALYVLPDSPTQRTSISCYNSILRPYNHKFGRYNAAVESQDRILRQAGVQREERQLANNGGKCSPHIAVVLRSKKWFIKRTIPDENITKLRSALETRGLKPEFVEDLGHISFDSQISLFQRTDVLFVVHGAELSNALFMRKGSRIVEVFPFGYFAECFKKIYRPVHLLRRAVSSPPDVKVTEECFEKERKRNWSNQTRTQLEDEARKYSTRVESFRTERNETRREEISLYYSRFCTKKQQILTDPERLADIVAEEAQKFCNK